MLSDIAIILAETSVVYAIVHIAWIYDASRVKRAGVHRM